MCGLSNGAANPDAQLSPTRQNSRSKSSRCLHTQFTSTNVERPGSSYVKITCQFAFEFIRRTYDLVLCNYAFLVICFVQPEETTETTTALTTVVAGSSSSSSSGLPWWVILLIVLSLILLLLLILVIILLLCLW